MLFVAVAIAWALGCVAAASLYPRSLARLELAAWAAALEDALGQAGSDPERVAMANDAIAELEHQLVARQGLASAAAWLTLAGSALALVAGALTEPHLALLLILLVALLGVGGCTLAGRIGRSWAARRRKRVDSIVRDLAGDLYDLEVELPQRRSLSRRRRRA